MKKLLVMLLAVTMVLSMAFTFAACGGDDAESSSASESVADSSAADESAASSEAESSEESASESESEAESVADSSVESVESSEAESSEEPSEAESSEESSEVVSESEVESTVDSESKADDESSVTPTGSAIEANYATGATYTITKNGSSEPATLFLPDVMGGTTFTKWGDVDFTKLTDGLTAAGKDMNGNGSLEGVTVTMVGSNAEFEIIIDLGQTRTDIKSFKFLGVRNGVANKNNRGFEADLALFYVSDTPGDWGKFLTTEFTSEQLADAPLIKHQTEQDQENIENFTYTFTLDTAVSGRYVKMLLCPGNVYCLQFDEIVISNK